MDPQKKLLRFVLLFLLLYAMAALASAGAELRQCQAEKLRLSRELYAIEAENALLLQRLSQGIDREEIIQLARQRLGLVLPGEKIFYFTDREA